MSRKIFISYEFAEGKIARTLPSWFQPWGKCQGKGMMVDPVTRSENEIDFAIRAVMQACDIALFLKSDNVHNKPWIDREAQIAISLGMPIVVIPLPGHVAGPPNRLAHHRGIHIVTRWDPDELCRTLNKIKV
jgi:hypothetical protein